MTSLSFKAHTASWQRSNESLLVGVIAVLGFSILTAACAQVSFWIGPVPVTGQTLGVLLSGLFLGSRKGALSQLSYIAIGTTGLPFWFAPGGAPGIMRLIGPTGGYLIGFVAMAFVVGWLLERLSSRHILLTAVAALSATIFLYICGLSWLSMYIPASDLLAAGLFPFVVGDSIKIMVAALVLHSVRFVGNRITCSRVIRG